MVKLKNCQIGEKNWCGCRYGPHDYDSGNDDNNNDDDNTKKVKKSQQQKK